MTLKWKKFEGIETLEKLLYKKCILLKDDRVEVATLAKEHNGHWKTKDEGPKRRVQEWVESYRYWWDGTEYIFDPTHYIRVEDLIELEKE